MDVAASWICLLLASCSFSIYKTSNIQIHESLIFLGQNFAHTHTHKYSQILPLGDNFRLVFFLVHYLVHSTYILCPDHHWNTSFYAHWIIQEHSCQIGIENRTLFGKYRNGTVITRDVRNEIFFFLERKKDTQTNTQILNWLYSSNICIVLVCQSWIIESLMFIQDQRRLFSQSLDFDYLFESWNLFIYVPFMNAMQNNVQNYIKNRSCVYIDQYLKLAWSAENV